MLPVPPRLKFHGNTHAAKQFKRFALSQLEILKKQMSFQGLKQGVRRVSPFEGVLIECVSKFGLHVVNVFVAPVVITPSYAVDKLVVSEDQVKICEQVNDLLTVAVGLLDGTVYLTKILIDEPTTLFHPFKKLETKYNQSILWLYKYRFEEDIDKNIITIEVSHTTVVVQKIQRILDDNTCKNFDDEEQLYKDIFLTSNFTPTVFKYSFPTMSIEQMVFKDFDGSIKTANISDDKNTLYICCGLTCYILEYDIENVTWNTTKKIHTLPSDTTGNITFVDSDGFGHGIWKSELVDNPDYIPCPTPELYPGSSVEYKNTVEQIQKYTAYKINIISGELLEIDERAVAVEIADGIQGLMVDDSYDIEATNWGEDHIVVTGCSVGGPSHVHTAIGSCGSFIICDNLDGGSEKFIMTVNSWYDEDIDFCFPSGVRHQTRSYTGNLIRHEEGVSFKGSHYAEKTIDAWYTEDYIYTNNFVNSQVQIFHSSTSTNATLYAHKSLIVQYGTATVSIDDRNYTITNGVIMPLIKTFVTETIYGGVLEPFDVPNAIGTRVFSGGDGGGTESLYLGKSIKGLFYTELPETTPVGQNWKIELGGTSITGELFVDKLKPPTINAFDPENWLPEIEDKTELAYIKYLF